MDEMAQISLEVGNVREALSDVVNTLTDVEARLATLETKIARVLLESGK
jgi:hypothetical protein